jgi:hypothetical protein
MAISRSDMERQLRKDGGILTLEDAKRMAPPGESLAYINPDEAALLKSLGGAGEDINGTGIKSYFLKKIFKKAKTAEGAAGIGGALFGGWLGSSMGIAAPSLIPAIFGTAITGIFPVAAVGAGFGYLAVKIIKYKRKLREIEKRKKTNYCLAFIYYNFSRYNMSCCKNF